MPEEPSSPQPDPQPIENRPAPREGFETRPAPTEQFEERGAAEWVGIGVAATDLALNAYNTFKPGPSSPPPSDPPPADPPQAEAPQIELPPGVDRE